MDEDVEIQRQPAKEAREQMGIEKEMRREEKTGEVSGPNNKTFSEPATTPQ